ncbi:MAG: prepilin peptidase [Gammaproteobacteria bacterium]|nr:prepilin peptidase [Gammaproteobacteria bacterium]MCP4088620.1 prepilin peptidase [Gammaproteobacteria bacterium]MCP4276472.1 prepilin peptidase [Gammaproteobacteria bacterium]MCP4832349.1 prepilin peptidase [Gammaproteobacteria bacterium]MCP4929137.1 prepilin peptidase [Gammaproteobacteria bacterium]
MVDIAAISGGVVLGLLFGSFLNVVIYRLPIMLEREWQLQANELLNGQAGASSEPQAPFNLLTPRSRCSSCGTQVASWQNIPIISWLFLRGQCAYCKASISIRYPIIELLSGILSGIVVWQFGTGLTAAVTLIFVWGLIVLTMIDIDHQLLPDNITYPLLWLGLSFSLLHDPAANLPFPDSQTAIIGAIAGYLSLWSVYWLFKLATGKEGMGYGDFKLLAVLGAWLGWKMLPLIILLSAVVGAIVGIMMIILLDRDHQIPIPFGPYLAGAGLIALLWGDSIINAYLNYSGL